MRIVPADTERDLHASLGGASSYQLRGDGVAEHHDNTKHVLVYGDSAERRRLLTKPTLRSWRGSCVVLDWGGRLTAATSGYRCETLDQCVHVLDPSDLTKSVWRSHYNPLDAMVPINGRPMNSRPVNADYWSERIGDPFGMRSSFRLSQAVKTFLAALLVYCWHKSQHDKPGARPSLHDAATLFKHAVGSDAVDTTALWFDIKAMIDFLQTHHRIEARSTIDSFRRFINTDALDRSAIAQLAALSLRPYTTPTIEADLAAFEHWNPTDLMTGDVPETVYLVLPEDDASAESGKASVLSQAVAQHRLALSQTIASLIDGLRFVNDGVVSPRNHRVLLLLDGFTRLGRMPDLVDTLGFMSGYGVVSYMLADDSEQVGHVYGNELNGARKSQAA